MKRKYSLGIFLMLLVVTALSVTIPVSAKTKTYSENGAWKRKIGKTTWYFDVNDYTSMEPGSKYYGVVYIYKGKKNYNSHNFITKTSHSKNGLYTLKTQ